MDIDWMDDMESGETRLNTPKEEDIFNVLDTYLTIMTYLLHRPSHISKKKLAKDTKKIKKVAKALRRHDGSIKKYLREDEGYYDHI